MTKNKDKELIPFFSKSNQIIQFHDVIEINLNPKEQSQQEYFLDRIKELEQLVKKLNPDYINQLEKFRDLLSGSCFKKFNSKITVIQCDKKCDFKGCPTKIRWINLLKVEW